MTVISVDPFPKDFEEYLESDVSENDKLVAEWSAALVAAIEAANSPNLESDEVSTALAGETDIVRLKMANKTIAVLIPQSLVIFN